MVANLFRLKSRDAAVVSAARRGIGLRLIGMVLLHALCLVGIVSLPALGHEWWAFSGVGLLWIVLLAFGRRLPKEVAGPERSPLRERLLGFSKKSLVCLLALWLGLILWEKLGPGGAAPPPKADPAQVRVVTWNIHCGQDHGLPWKQFDWPVRKLSLQAALAELRPDVFCVQEATGDQVVFLEAALPEHHRVGVGRDNSAGEHCAIYFRKSRFEELGSGTFWLEAPIDQPGGESLFDLKRICTWVRLRDRQTGRTMRIYNTHLYLTEEARLPAVRTILAQLALGDPQDAVLLAADFNATPTAASRRLFAAAGFGDTAALAGKSVAAKTLHFYGIPFRSIDAILVKPGWLVHEHRILSVKPENVFPSDHFAVLTDLSFAD